MCLIVFALDAHPRYKLVLAANRDEFYNRPTAPAAVWFDAPEVLAGKDLAAGGTWLGLTKQGRFAAVTNYRDPRQPVKEKSRGRLTRNFLVGADSPPDYLQKISAEKENYAGFNLLVGDFGGESKLFYYSNRGAAALQLSAGIYGLSNHLLDTAWHKVEESKTRFAKVLRNSIEISPESLFPILADRAAAPDEKLPDTGVGLKRERILSPAFIETNGYGTRSSTVVTIDRRGTAASFTEKTFVGATGEVRHEFELRQNAAR